MPWSFQFHYQFIFTAQSVKSKIQTEFYQHEVICSSSRLRRRGSALQRRATSSKVIQNQRIYVHKTFLNVNLYSSSSASSSSSSSSIGSQGGQVIHHYVQSGSAPSSSPVQTVQYVQAQQPQYVQYVQPQPQIQYVQAQPQIQYVQVQQPEVRHITHIYHEAAEEPAAPAQEDPG